MRQGAVDGKKIEGKEGRRVPGGRMRVEIGKNIPTRSTPGEGLPVIKTGGREEKAQARGQRERPASRVP